MIRKAASIRCCVPAYKSFSRYLELFILLYDFIEGKNICQILIGRSFLNIALSASVMINNAVRIPFCINLQVLRDDDCIRIEGNFFPLVVFIIPAAELNTRAVRRIARSFKACNG